MKSPIPRLESNGRPLITSRKFYYRLILRLGHQSLIVHSGSIKGSTFLLAPARGVEHRWQARYVLNLPLSCPPIALL